MSPWCSVFPGSLFSRVWSFSRNPSILLAFPSMLLHFPFILESVFNFPALSFILIFLCQPKVFYFPCIVVSFLSRYPFHGLLYTWLISLCSSACKAFHHTLYIKTTTKTPQKKWILIITLHCKSIFRLYVAKSHFNLVSFKTFYGKLDLLIVFNKSRNSRSFHVAVVVCWPWDESPCAGLRSHLSFVHCVLLRKSCYLLNY